MRKIFTSSLNQFKSKWNAATPFHLLYLVYFITLPFIYSAKLIDPALLPRQIALTSIILLLVISLLFQFIIKKQTLNFAFIKHPLIIIYSVYILCVILSAIQANAISESLYFISKTLIAFTYFIITTYLIRQKILSLNYLLKITSFYIALVISIGIYQILFQDLDIRTITSTSANKNLFASIIILSVPFVMSAIISFKKWRIAYILLLFILTGFIWILQAKASIIAFSLIIVLVLVALLIFSINQQRWRYLLISIAIIAPLVTVSVLISNQNKKYFNHLYYSTSIQTRTNIWDNTIQMIQDHPLTGVGAGNWKIHFPKYGLNRFRKPAQDGTKIFQRPHNEFLLAFAELGIFGFISFASLFVLTCYYLLGIIREQGGWKNKLIYGSFLAGIIGFKFILAVDFPLERIEHLTLFHTILAIVVAKYGEQKPFKPLKLKSSLFYLFIVICGIICLSFYTSINRFIAEQQTMRIYQARALGNHKKVIRNVDRIKQHCYELDPVSIPLLWYKGNALFSLGKYSLASKCYELAYQQAPYNIHVINNLASSHEKSGNRSLAIELYLKALDISNNFEESILNLSAAYFNNGEYIKAFTTIDKCSINTKHIKYNTYLPVILKSYVGTKFGDNQANINEQRTFINTEDTNKLRELYFESKKHNIMFDKYLLNK